MSRNKLVNLIPTLFISAGIALTLPSIAVADSQGAVFSRDSVIYGRTYSDWSAAWQQWADSMPATSHPLFDTADCSEGQSGKVWFLGGRFCSSENGNCGSLPAEERTCTVPVPAGTALYFPIVNFGCLNVEAENGSCEESEPFITQMRSAIGEVIDQTTDFELKIDGRKVNVDLKNDFRVQSTVYAAVLPEDNLLEAIGEDVDAGTYWGVDDGIYVMLEPLRSGNHTIYFKGRFPPPIDFTLEFTYHLTVQ